MFQFYAYCENFMILCYYLLIYGIVQADFYAIFGCNNDINRIVAKKPVISMKSFGEIFRFLFTLMNFFL